MGGEMMQMVDHRQRRGQTLDEMSPEQRQAVIDWHRNAAGADWWRAQGAAQRGDMAAANAHMAASNSLRVQGQRIADLYGLSTDQKYVMRSAGCS